MAVYSRDSSLEYRRFVKLLREQLPDEWERLGRPNWYKGLNSVMYQVIWKQAGARLREENPEVGKSFERVCSSCVRSYAWFALGVLCLIVAGQAS